MNGKEFIRRVQKLGRAKGIAVTIDKAHGKGSHQTLFYGAGRTTVKHGEIGKGLLSAMLKQLGIDPKEF
jgi:mRNA interferase HicA